jgi:Na+/H+-dicarboxylate symporter
VCIYIYTYVYILHMCIGRMMTIVNVTGDCIVARVVTEWTKNDGLELEKVVYIYIHMYIYIFIYIYVVTE